MDASDWRRPGTDGARRIAPAWEARQRADKRASQPVFNGNAVCRHPSYFSTLSTVLAAKRPKHDGHGGHGKASPTNHRVSPAQSVREAAAEHQLHNSRLLQSEQRFRLSV